MHHSMHYSTIGAPQQRGGMIGQSNMTASFTVFTFTPGYECNKSLLIVAPRGFDRLIVVVVVVVVLINSHNQVRGHRTGSSHSGAEEHPREKNTNKPKVVSYIGIPLHSDRLIGGPLPHL